MLYYIIFGTKNNHKKSNLRIIVKNPIKDSVIMRIDVSRGAGAQIVTE